MLKRVGRSRAFNKTHPFRYIGTIDRLSTAIVKHFISIELFYFFNSNIIRAVAHPFRASDISIVDHGERAEYRKSHIIALNPINPLTKFWIQLIQFTPCLVHLIPVPSFRIRSNF